MAIEVTEKQARYIADYVEEEYSERACELEFYEVILNAVEAINGGALDGYRS